MKKSLKRTVYAIGKDYLIPISAVLISFVAVCRTEKAEPDYALVSKDGEVVSRRGMQKYGLFAERKMEVRSGREIPYYVLTFSKEPEYFEVTTRHHAIVDVNQVSPRKYKVTFVRPAFGDAIIESNFKVQAY